MRLIDADALVKGIEENHLGEWYVGRIDGKSEEIIPTETVYKLIKDAHTEVVLCKDCKHFDHDGANTDGWGWCNKNDSDWRVDDFCSWGKRGKK